MKALSTVRLILLAQRYHLYVMLTSERIL
ncbi:Protein of unknown function [Cotesia congregata]|uniref:Uncharacterized protein n=1 Tax=Cotesia congregata TaxID=51543 RepID=A0A8J2HGC8_COTCN|nr:Protein of unknown function [Cotesia congregata]